MKANAPKAVQNAAASGMQGHVWKCMPQEKKIKWRKTVSFYVCVFVERAWFLSIAHGKNDLMCPGVGLKVDKHAFERSFFSDQW